MDGIQPIQIHMTQSRHPERIKDTSMTFKTLFFLKSPAIQLTRAGLACGFMFLSGLPHADARGAGPFSDLAGYWSGSGIMRLANGTAERIRCRASYAVAPGGRAAQQTLRCASASYRLDISSNVISEGGALSGSWTETSRGVSGNISGRASGSQIVANVWGAGFAASFDILTRGHSQSVTIRPQQGTDVAAVSISLHKG